MPPLPRISGREAVRALERAGWAVARSRGSHRVMTRPGSVCTISVPNHAELDRGTLRSVIRMSGLSVGEFLALL